MKKLLDKNGIFMKYKHALLFVLFLVVHGSYFLLQKYQTSHFNIKIGLDDLIPFNEWFIIPYVFWYLYISLPMVYLCFKSKQDFVKMALYVFSGIGVALLIFAFFPNAIDFRPQSFERDNILIDMVKMIYASDRPTNVFPSLHCYESVAIHVALTKSKTFGDKKVFKLVSLIICVLICLATVFIKQHSVLDLLGGVALAMPMYFLVYRKVYKSHRKEKKPVLVPAAK